MDAIWIEAGLVLAYLCALASLFCAALPVLLSKDKTVNSPKEHSDNNDSCSPKDGVLVKLLAGIALAFGGMGFVWFILAIILNF